MKVGELMKNEFDDLAADLKKKQQELSDFAENTTELNHSEIFPEKFMKEHTNFSDVYDFFENGGFSKNEYFAYENKELDDYVAKNSDFQNYQEMLETGTDIFMEKKLSDIGF
ncbi:hypothetical protein GSH19_05055 [Lactobacillus sp. S2-2]|uniref:hypothetical protein n=1 Tax=Lactobacillus sp. S2-2 TaxID=2692917 RepID=UPI001F445D76|nr:hypothetical protein [Lactobacillus sp. S2-2]MCF6515520.1 hypothetical protein [Lactobacillus sp. S2-2]